MLSLIGRCRDGQGNKCDRDGVMLLVAPDGLVVPGVTMCREHAEECVKEYAEKLGERWTMIDVRTNEQIYILSKTIKKPIDPLQEALDALQGLMDVQNGPPLLREQDKNAWQTAMDTANEVLKKHRS